MKFSKSPGISGYTVYIIVDALCFVTWVSWFFLALNVILNARSIYAQRPELAADSEAKEKVTPEMEIIPNNGPKSVVPVANMS